MPSLLDIRRRVRAVKSTQQITKAMKMVAASRLRRAQERIQNGRPFANEMRRVLQALAARVETAVHPLLDDRSVPRANGRVLLIVVTADRGLCGSFNTNIIKAAGSFITDTAGRQVALSLVGRRGRDFFARRGFQVLDEQINLFAQLRFEHAKAIADAAMEAFASGEVDAVHLAYNEFKSVMVQQVTIEQLLPIPRGTFDTPAQPGATAPPLEYLYEPQPAELFKTLLPTYVEVQVFRALLESNAAFYAAQMTAMDAATRNSGEMIDQLTLYMNKVRQAAITREIIEVVSGAQAL
jgi:F-type H+-transporting ATPase subunit gamma